MAGVALAGVGMSAAGQMQAGQAAQNSAEYNAALGEMAARDAMERGESDKQTLAQQFGRDMSTGKAQIGASGVRVGTGSGLDWENELIDTYVADKAAIDMNTANKVAALRNGSTLDLAEGNSARSAANMAAAGSLLSGAGRVADKWYTPRSTGTV
jgi:hypothetical protein